MRIDATTVSDSVRRDAVAVSDPLADLEGLLIGAAKWSELDLKTNLAQIVAHTQAGAFVPWRSWYTIGQAWAQDPAGYRLLDALALAFAPTDDHQHRGVFEGMRYTAIARADGAMFKHLMAPRFHWSAFEQAKAFCQISTRPLEDAKMLAEAFWSRLEQVDRPGLYQAIAQQSWTLPKRMARVLALHRGAPSPCQAHLETGVLAVLTMMLNYDALLTSDDKADVTEELTHAWGQAREQVSAVRIWKGLWAQMGQNGRTPFEPDSCDALLADHLLADLSPDLQVAWMDRLDVDLPRTRAAHRQHQLGGRPSSEPRRPRPRS